MILTDCSKKSRSSTQQIAVTDKNSITTTERAKRPCAPPYAPISLSRRVSVGRSRHCGVGLVHELCCYELGIWGPSGQAINGAVTSPSSPRFVTVSPPSIPELLRGGSVQSNSR